jgi:predicted O-methyltransferase YrrM
MEQSLSKPSLLWQTFLRDPREFCDRVATFAECKLDQLRPPATMARTDSDELICDLGERLSIDLRPFMSDRDLEELQGSFAVTRERIGDAAIDTLHNPGLGRVCYTLTRALRPNVAVETGVAFGVTSAFFLKGMAANDNGILHSIDLPPLGQDGTGIFVPSDLRSRWRLHRGKSRRVLRPLLSTIPIVDIFLHDSLQTYRNMSFEYETVWSHLRPGGVLISDDVALNRAFENFAQMVRPSFVAVDKTYLFGIAVK